VSNRRTSSPEPFGDLFGDLARDRCRAGERAAGVFAGLAGSFWSFIRRRHYRLLRFSEDIESFWRWRDNLYRGRQGKGRYSNIRITRAFFYDRFASFEQPNFVGSIAYRVDRQGAR